MTVVHDIRQTSSIVDAPASDVSKAPALGCGFQAAAQPGKTTRSDVRARAALCVCVCFFLRNWAFEFEALGEGRT